MSKLVVACICGLFFVGGMLIGDFANLNERFGIGVLDTKSTEVHRGGSAFINPLLECEIGADTFKLSGLNPLKVKLEEFVDYEKQRGKISRASIYFRDLNNGPWFGIGEDGKFAPASLLKLPIAITYYKKAEKDSKLLAEEIKYEEETEVFDSIFAKESTLEIGKSYTVKNLIERMLQFSDNSATALLSGKLGGGEPVLNVMREIGVEIDNTDPNGDVITVQGYATLFRILFNASYLTQDNSSQILKILSKSHFEDGLRAGVPKRVKISHKYGERQVLNVNQLHDCGIVYFKNNPYILCIMTRGNDYNNLADFILSVSDIVYKDIEERHSKLQ